MKRNAFLFTAIFLFMYSQTNAQKIVEKRPSKPTEKLTEPQECPPGYIWEGDDWKWDNKTQKYEWEPGECVRIKNGHMWIPGQWSRIAEGWSWTGGHWRKL